MCQDERQPRINKNSSSTAGAISLSKIIKKMKDLVTLSLACCRLGNEGMMLVVEAVASHPNLTTFDLSDNEVTGSAGIGLLM
jgi:Ran GTPase-activating protein (RanGAP) involved in mRNA processing and transport